MAGRNVQISILLFVIVAKCHGSEQRVMFQTGSSNSDDGVKRLKKAENDGSSTKERPQTNPTPDKQKPYRFQCFCSHQYASYGSLYCHLSKKHTEFFQTNRKFYTTHTISTIDPVHGYPIKKLFKERVVHNRGGQQQGGRERYGVPLAEIDRRMRPQYQFDAVQLEIGESLRNNQAKRRTLEVNLKILQKEEELLEETQTLMRDYETVLRLMGIKEITSALDMKLQEFPESESENMLKEE